MASDFKQVIDELWDAFEEIGIEDGYDIVAQATLLLAVRRLDVIHTAAEKKANVTGRPIESPVFDAETEATPLVEAEEPRGRQNVRPSETDGHALSPRVAAGPWPTSIHDSFAKRSEPAWSTCLTRSPMPPATNGAVYEY